MKVNIDGDKTIVFLNKFNVKDIDFKNRENIETSFKNIFLKLKHIYNLNIKGYYNINTYIDNYYGAIMEIEHEDIDYYDYFDSQVDMRVNIVKDNNFLYKIKDIFMIEKKLIDKIEVYTYKNNYYVKLKKDATDYQIGKLLEISEIIYNEKTFDILKYGKKL